MHLISPGFPRPNIALHLQIHGPKHHSFHYIVSNCPSTAIMHMIRRADLAKLTLVLSASSYICLCFVFDERSSVNTSHGRCRCDCRDGNAASGHGTSQKGLHYVLAAKISSWKAQMEIPKISVTNCLQKHIWCTSKSLWLCKEPLRVKWSNLMGIYIQ